MSITVAQEPEMKRIAVSPRDARRMILDGTAPDNMVVDGTLNLTGCTSLTALPEGLSVGGSLDLTGCTALTALPDGLSVGGSLDLFGCTSLTALPESLSVGGSLYLTGCKSLAALPEGLSVGRSLDLTGCTSLTALPHRIRISRHSGRALAHSGFILIWTGERYIAGCHVFTPAEALEHWGNPHRRDDRARIFRAAIEAHQREIAA